jgi:hypothetical protein
MSRLLIVVALPVSLLACGGKQPTGGGGGGDGDSEMSMMDKKMDDGMQMSGDPASEFGPLEVGADWFSYQQLSSASFPSPTHGGRMVDVWVNGIGVDAYVTEGEEIPVGTIVVKTSTEKNGRTGPTFVMEKREPGFNPEQGDWWYAIHWAEPAEGWTKKGGGPIYWRTPSAKVGYCFDCHDSFDRQLGGIPLEHRAE